MADWQRQKYEAFSKGMSLNGAIDQLGQKHALVKNLRSYSNGRLEPRRGLTALNNTALGAPDPVHTIKRLNDDTVDLFTLLLGAGTKLYSTAVVIGATNANPIVIQTDRAHNATTGDIVVISGVTGNTNANGSHAVTVTDSTHFSIVAIGNGTFGGTSPQAFFLRDTGYSGEPLQIVTDRPDASPKSFAYIADTQRTRKMSVEGADYPWGIAQPRTAPTIKLGGKSYKVVSLFDVVTESGVAWVQGGTAGAPAVLSGTPATIIAATNATPIVVQSSAPHGFSSGDNVHISGALGNTAANGDWLITVVDATHFSLIGSVGNGAWTSGGTVTRYQYTGTIIYILYDSGSTGFASVSPSVANAGLQPGMLMVVNTGGGTAETVLVEQVFNAIANTTILSIQYDIGSTGPCTIQLTTPTAGLVKNAMVRLGGTAENVLIDSVTPSPDGNFSFRCTTVNTHAAADAVTGLASFRAVFANSHSAGESLIDNGLQASVTVGTGYIEHLFARDLSSVNGRTITTDDEIVFLFRMDTPSLLTEGRLIFDLDSAINDAGHNALLKAFRTSDLQTTLSSPGDSTTVNFRQTLISRGFLDNTDNSDVALNLVRNKQSDFLPIDGGDPGDPQPPIVGFTPNPVSQQTSTGSNQLTALTVKVGDLTQVGSDLTKSLKDVKSIRIQLTTTGTLAFTAIDLWIGGTSGPDVGQQGADYKYRYIYRSTITGNPPSNPSPETRNGVHAVRQRITGTVPTPDTRPATGDAQIDKADVYRIGGSLTSWTYALSVDVPANSAASTVSFNDDLPDDSLNVNQLLDFESFAPWPTLDLPRSGTCNVVGTTVKRLTGDNFNTSWAPFDGPTEGEATGTIIEIAGIAYAVYSQPTDTDTLEIRDSAGNQTAVKWSIREPLLLSQPLPAVWGPFGGGLEGEVIFACGSPFDQGTLFWTTFSSPDSTRSINRLEITSPSEPLIGGCLYDGRPYVWSSERKWEIVPNFTASAQFQTGGSSDFVAREVANSKGLLSRHNVASAQVTFATSRDGINADLGSAQPYSVTDEDLYPIFPTEANPGDPVLILGLEHDDEKVEFSAPDFTALDKIRLAFYMDWLYLDFQDQNAEQHTLIMDGSALRTSQEGIAGSEWYYDEYKVPILTHYGEEGDGANRLLCGSSNGKVYVYEGLTDDGVAFDCDWISGAMNQSDGRLIKEYGDLMLDIDTDQADVFYSYFLGRGTDVFKLAQVPLTDPLVLVPISNSERNLEIIDFTFGPNVSTDIGIRLQWSSLTQRPIVYGWEPSFVSRGTDTLLRPTEWDSGGKLNNKFVYGCIIYGDTGGADRSLVIRKNGVGIGPTIIATLEGWQPKTFTFEPFYAQNVRLVRTDSNSWRCGMVEWLTADAADFVALRSTQESTHGLPGYQVIPEIQILYRSNEDITFTLWADGQTYIKTLPNSNNVFTKLFFRPTALKAKVFQYRAQSATGSLIDGDGLEIKVRAWGDPGPLVNVQPFAASTETGARV